MKRSPERVAWSILFAALFTCCGLTIGVPTAVLAFVNTATVEANADVKLQAGILKSYSRFETEGDARVVSLDGRGLSEGSTVIVGPESVGVLTIDANDGSGPLITIQLYSNANIRVERVRLPRFSSSFLGDDFTFHLGAGRIHVSAQTPEGRKFRVRLTSGHANTLIETNGTYFLEETDSDTRIEVARGQATVSTLKGDTTINLNGGDRTAVTGGTEGARVAGVLPPYRNLIRDGQFQAQFRLKRDWSPIADVAAGNNVSGTVKSVGEGASSALSFERVGNGLGWGRTGISQTVSADVRDRRSLLLRVNFQIIEQEIPVCGGEGSECPFMLRVDYTDASGAAAYRIKGFYGRGTPTPDKLPDYVRSNNQGNHVFRQLGMPATFEWDLTDLLPQMRTIESVSIYAEGHTVRAQVSSVELLLQD